MPQRTHPGAADSPALGDVGESDVGSSLRFYDVVSADGTRLRAWTNDADGPVVLLCNGLGTNPYTWPALLRRDCGVRVVSWNHRGVGGSERPADPTRVGVADFVDDALAVLDDAGLDRVPVLGWSIGVNTMFELALLHPDRVTGLFAVCGVPGGTFASMGAPIFLPRPVRRPLTVGITSLLGRAGPALTPVTTRLPVGSRGGWLLAHSGLMLPGADPAAVARAVREFLSTPIDWYMHLALAASQHRRISLRSVRVPTAFVAGTWDVLASAHDMRTAAERIPGATYTELPASHFVQLERPHEVHEHVLAFLART